MLPINKCPRCGCRETMRSHRTHLERLLMVLKPLRCLDCKHRFIVFERVAPNRRPA